MTNRKRLFVAALSLIPFFFACSEPAPAPEESSWPSADYLEAHEAWRRSRVEGLTAADGWLATVGLYWLDEGSWRFGTGEDNDIVLPRAPSLEGEPETLGVLYIRASRVTLEPASGASLTVDGEPFETMPLASDASETPTVVSVGSYRLHIIDRGGHLGLRLRDEEAPARQSLQEIETYPLVESFVLEGRFEPYEAPRNIPVPNITDFEYDDVSPGEIVLEIDGEEHRFRALGDSSDDELFLIVGDATNGKETYGGGRYVYTAPPDAEGRVIADFNRLYNPPCVFTSWATCPLPPPENVVDVPIRAGEKIYRGAH